MLFNAGFIVGSFRVFVGFVSGDGEASEARNKHQQRPDGMDARRIFSSQKAAPSLA
jgi:hypothetical protein